MTSILGYKTADLGQWAVLFALKNVYYKRDDHNYQNIDGEYNTQNLIIRHMASPPISYRG